jgi:hypothetical protein
MSMGKRAECSVYSLAYLPSVVVLVDGSNGRPCRRGDLLNISRRSDTSLVPQPYFVLCTRGEPRSATPTDPCETHTVR